MLEILSEALKAVLPLLALGLLIVLGIVVTLVALERIMDRWFSKTDRELVEDLLSLSKSLVAKVNDLDRRVEALEAEQKEPEDV